MIRFDSKLIFLRNWLTIRFAIWQPCRWIIISFNHPNIWITLNQKKFFFQAWQEGINLSPRLLSLPFTFQRAHPSRNKGYLETINNNNTVLTNSEGGGGWIKFPLKVPKGNNLCTLRVYKLDKKPSIKFSSYEIDQGNRSSKCSLSQPWKLWKQWDHISMVLPPHIGVQLGPKAVKWKKDVTVKGLNGSMKST